MSSFFFDTKFHAKPVRVPFRITCFLPVSVNGFCDSKTTYLLDVSVSGFCGCETMYLLGVSVSGFCG
jgi:hypothetical protein